MHYQAEIGLINLLEKQTTYVRYVFDTPSKE